MPFLSRAGANLYWYYYNTTLLTRTTAAQNEVALFYHRLRGLYFLAVVFYSEGNALFTDWVRRKGLFELTFERPSLYIKTNGTKTESGDVKSLQLQHTYNNTGYVMSLIISFGSWDFELTSTCEESMETIKGTLKDVPASSYKVWRVAKHLESLSVECNTVEVLEVKYQDYLNQDCMEIIRGNESYFAFRNADTASEVATTGEKRLDFGSLSLSLPLIGSSTISILQQHTRLHVRQHTNLRPTPNTDRLRDSRAQGL